MKGLTRNEQKQYNGSRLTAHGSRPIYDSSHNHFSHFLKLFALAVVLCLLSFGTSWAENITVIQPTGGTVSYEDWNFYGQDTVRLHNKPNDGYRFVRYIVKDTSGNDITLSSNQILGENGNWVTAYYFVKQDATITAEFERSAYSITVTNPAGGTVTASPSSGSEGDKVNLSYTVNSGYIFRRFIVSKTSDNSEVSVINGSSLEGQEAWYFNMPDGDVTVTAEFAAAHAITVNTPENGSITAPASAAAGDTVQFTVGANSGYEVKDCTVTKTGDSGVSVSTSIIFNDPDGKMYSFTMPDYPVTVSARTELKVCPITWNTADCTVNGPAQGHLGAEITFTVTPSDGYRVRTISVNGEKVYGIVRTAVSGNVYTYKMTLQALALYSSSYVVDVECDNEDNAGFLITKELGQQANVSVTNSAGEEITRAEGGEAVTIKLLNQDIIDYHGNTSGNVFYPTGTDPYTGKDRKLLSGNDTFTMPFCDMTVQAGGVAETFNLTCSSSANGTITANSSTPAAGFTVELTITPDEGYMFENVIVDGQDVALYVEDGDEYVEDGDDNSYIYSFTMPGHDVNVSAVFVPSGSGNFYRITYDLDGGRFDEAGYRRYTANTETFTLDNPTRAGYTFAGWTGSNGVTPQTAVQIAKGSTGDKSYKATWTLNTYNITYNLTGGRLADGVSNPTSYTAETEIFTLNNPVHYGAAHSGGLIYELEDYTFTGWTGTGLDHATKLVTIPQGSIGDRVYTATWTPNFFRITYNLGSGGFFADGVISPTRYTVETPTFTVNEPTRIGYTFTGWTGTGLDGATMAITIPQGSIGNRVYTANWTANTYTVKFNANGGTGEMSSQSYTYDTAQAITANAFTRTDYTFAGWNTEADGSGTGYTDGQEVSNLAGGGEVTLYAQWRAITYTITYSGIDGATFTANNPAEYTVEDSFTLTNPTKDGYTFTGWTLDGSNDDPALTVTVRTGTTGNLAYTANWQKNAFSPKDSAIPEFAYHSLILSGQIGVIFHVYAPEGLASKDFCVYFDVSGDKSQNTQPVYAFETMTEDGKNFLGFKCYINSIQMADKIHAELHYKNTNASEQTITHDYTANQYLSYIIGDTTQADDTRELGRAIMDFGSYVQPVLAKENGWEISKDHAEMTPANDYDDTYFTATQTATQSHALTNTLTDSSGIDEVKFALMLDSETTIILCLIPKSDYNGEVSAYVDGGNINMAVKYGDYYTVSIGNISAHELGETHNIEITTQYPNAESDSFTVNISALSYVQSAIQQDDTDMKRAVTSLYRYYDSTMTYRKNRPEIYGTN